MYAARYIVASLDTEGEFDAIRSASETVQAAVVQILAEPGLVLQAYDNTLVTLAADEARQQRISAFYGELEALESAGRHSEAVRFMREEAEARGLYDVRNRAALNTQMIMSNILFEVSQGVLGYIPIQDFAKQKGTAYLFKAADKNVASMLKLAEITEPTTLYMGFAVYGETVRLFNEDFMGMKLRQMQRLVNLNNKLKVEFMISDDEFAAAHPKADVGITMHSGTAVQLYLESRLGPGRDTSATLATGSIPYWEVRQSPRLGFKVVRVEDAIARERTSPGQVPVMQEYLHETRSRKGGSIQYVLWMGEQLSDLEPDRRAYVAYTDADISTDLMQTGLLVAPIRENGNAVMTVGSTESSGAVVAAKSFGRVIKSLVFNVSANLLLFLKAIDRVKDTQRGFKMFSPELLKAMHANFTQYPQEMAIDTALLAQAVALGAKVHEVPMAWMASEAESTVRPQDNSDMLYRVMLQRRQYVAPHQNTLQRLMGFPVVLFTGLMLKVLTAMINADRELTQRFQESFPGRIRGQEPDPVKIPAQVGFLQHSRRASRGRKHLRYSGSNPLAPVHRRSDQVCGRSFDRNFKYASLLWF